MLLTTSDAARLLNLAADTIRHLERSGRLPAVKTHSGMRLFNREDVLRLREERAKRRREVVR